MAIGVQLYDHNASFFNSYADSLCSNANHNAQFYEDTSFKYYNKNYGRDFYYLDAV